MSTLTIFSWGYWGWGTSTRQLKEAVNAAEADRGNAPLFFVDARWRRTGKAPGFVGNAFKDVIGDTYSLHEQRLGNWEVDSRARKFTNEYRESLEEDRERAVADLLQKAITREKQGQRVIFYCACVFPKWNSYPQEPRCPCHRDEIAEDLCKLARKKDKKNTVISRSSSGRALMEMRAPSYRWTWTV